jgi:hypothetical protein
MKEEKIVSQMAFILPIAPITSLIWKPFKSLLTHILMPYQIIQMEKLALLKEQKMVWPINY